MHISEYDRIIDIKKICAEMLQFTMDKYTNTHQLLLAFTRELQGTQGKGRTYASPLINLRGMQYRHYFTKAEVSKILQSNGSVNIYFLESIYKYEEYLEEFILQTTAEVKLPKYCDWIKEKDFKIVIKAGDITFAR